MRADIALIAAHAALLAILLGTGPLLRWLFPGAGAGGRRKGEGPDSDPHPDADCSGWGTWGTGDSVPPPVRGPDDPPPPPAPGFGHDDPSRHYRVVPPIDPPEALSAAAAAFSLPEGEDGGHDEPLSEAIRRIIAASRLPLSRRRPADLGDPEGDYYAGRCD